MRLGKTSSLDEPQVVSRFESLRKTLLSGQFADHIDKPLAYWALPTDRRLPLAFLGRTLRDLLGTSLIELTTTPGIGEKKIRSFVNLLARVANTCPVEPPVDPVVSADQSPPAGSSGGHDSDEAFDPTAVSEVVWAQWRSSVIRHELGGELLGRFAPSLQNMTRVIWNTPLAAYTHYTLAQIRAMKTHGEKRVRAILEVFHAVHMLVAHMGTQPHLVVRVVPRLITQAEEWLHRVLQTPGVPSARDISERFVGPLLEQVRVDATQQIVSLAESRLGLGGEVATVRQAARSMGLTRARVYQLLNEINDIMNVRWPHGRHLAYELAGKLHAEAAESQAPPDLSPLDAAIELFYPGARRGAAGPIEQPLGSLESAALETDDEGDFQLSGQRLD